MQFHKAKIKADLCLHFYLYIALIFSFFIFVLADILRMHRLNYVLLNNPVREDNLNIKVKSAIIEAAHSQATATIIYILTKNDFRRSYFLSNNLWNSVPESRLSNSNHSPFLTIRYIQYVFYTCWT
jgi:hypothetical protein